MTAFALFLCVVLAESDFSELSRQFEQAKIRVNRSRREERKKVLQRELLPVLKKIAALKSPEAVSFLEKVVQTDQPDIAAAACIPLARTGAAEAGDVLIRAVLRRPSKVAEAALEALKKPELPLRSEQLTQLGAIAAGKGTVQLRRRAVEVLGARQTVEAYRVLFKLLGRSRLDSAVVDAVQAVFSSVKRPELRRYLFGEALSQASKVRQQVVLLRAAAAAKAREAIDVAKKLIDSRSPEVAAAAVSALAALGVEGGADKIIAVLKSYRRNIERAVDLLFTLAEAGTPGASRILAAVSRSFSGPIGVAATALLGRARSEEALKRLIEALEDPDIAVRTAALRAIQQYRDKRIIAPLIGMLEREDGRLKGEAYKFLVKITGQSMGLSAEDWKKWWSFARKNFTFDKKRQGRTSVQAPRYYGIEIFSKRICFIIDCSSSMRRAVRDPKTGKKLTRIELAKRELIKTLKELKPGTMVNIISFSATYKPMSKTLIPLTRSGLRKAVLYVMNLRTGVGTNIYDTLSAALKDPRTDTIFLLSDGQPSRGKYTDPAVILREIRKQNLVRNVTINTIAIGVEQNLMKELARQNGGTYVFVKD